MAQDINEKVDQMTELQTQTISVTPDPITDEGLTKATEFDPSNEFAIDPELQGAIAEDKVMESQVNLDEYESVFVEDAAIKVAGGKKEIIGEVIKKLDKAEKAKQTKQLKQRLDETQKELDEAVDAEVKQKKKPTDVFNLNMIADDKSLAAWIEAGSKANKLDQFKNVSYKKIAAKYNQPKFAVTDESGVVQHIAVSQKGADQYIARELKRAKEQNLNTPILKIQQQPAYSEKWINDFLDPQNINNRRTIADPYEVYKAFHLLTQVSNEAYRKGEELVQAIAKKTDTDAMRVEFQQLVTLEGVLAKKVKGMQVDIAQSLGVLSEARKASDVSVGRLTEEAIETWGGKKSIDKFAKTYLKQKDQAKRHRLAEQTTNPWWKRVARIIPTTYTNNLISGIPTHGRNILGFASLSNFTKLENLIAVGIGRGRSAITGSKDRMVLEEAIAEMITTKDAMIDAFSSFYNAARHNKLRDRASKLNISDMRGQDAFKYDVAYIGKPIEYLGTYTTLSGRLLSSEDEFMKALAFHRKIKGLSTRARVHERQRLIDAGVDPELASKQALELEKKLMTEPTEDMIEEGTQFSRYLTQTTELGPMMKMIERHANNPAFKLFGMFLRVTSNIIGSASERNPILAIATPRFRANWAAGGAKRDMAISRLVSGTGFMYGMHSLTLDGKITGAMPIRREDRQAMIAAGWQPYSFVFNTGDLSEAAIERFKKITNVSISKDKVYISYQGLEPLSLLVAQAATVAELSMLNPDDDQGFFETIMYSGMAAAEYVSEHPLLQGMGRLMNIFTYYDRDGNELYDMLSKGGQEYANYLVNSVPSPVGTPVTIDGEKKLVAPLQSSFWRNVEKMIDPTASEYRAPTEMEEAGYYANAFNNAQKALTEGWMKGIRRACASTPGCSSVLERKLDPITGAPIENGMGNMYDLWLPFKTKKGITPAAHNVIMKYGARVPDVDKDYGVIDGVRISQSQRNKLVRYATKDGLLSGTILSLGKSLKDLNIPNEEKKSIINKEISNFYNAAKQLLLAEDAELIRKIQSVKRLQTVKDDNAVDLNQFLGD